MYSYHSRLLIGTSVVRRNCFRQANRRTPKEQRQRYITDSEFVVIEY